MITRAIATGIIMFLCAAAAVTQVGCGERGYSPLNKWYVTLERCEVFRKPIDRYYPGNEVIDILPAGTKVFAHATKSWELAHGKSGLTFIEIRIDSGEVGYMIFSTVRLKKADK